MKHTAEQIKSILENAPSGSQFYTDGYDVKYRKVIGDKYFGYLDGLGWVETCDKQLSQERIDKGWWIPNLLKELENQMNIDKVETQTPEEKEALDSIKPVHLRDYQKKTQTEHQEEMSAFSGGVDWSNGDECAFDDRTGIFIGLSKNKRLAIVEIDNEAINHDIDLVKVCDLSKPETKQQREDRERLEAAYDLYCEWVNNQNTLFHLIIGSASLTII